MELLIYFIFFVPRAEIPGERAKEEIPEEFIGDKIAPLTLVKFLQTNPGITLISKPLFMIQTSVVRN